MENIIGKTLGSYQIQSELSRKAGKITLLARDLITQELVVIKLLLFNDEFKWEDLEVFEREAQILENLTHPKLPRTLQSLDSQTPGYFGFVQSYIDAPSLEQHLKAGRTFTEIQVKQIARQILEILIYLHEQNPPIIHRDITPSNILFDNITGEAYLIDFGSVKTITSSNFEHTVVGTYGYMAPEQFEGMAVPASDLYSLGATLIYCCTGNHPADLLQNDLKIVTNLSIEFINWLQCITQPSLDARLHSARKALQVLEAPSQLVSAAIKPSGSKIKLTKSADTLEVVIPASGIDTSSIFIALFAVAWNSGMLAFEAGALSIPFPTNIILALFSLPFWGVGVFMVYWVLFCLFGKTSLQLNQHQISLTYELFGAKFHNTRQEAPSQLTIDAVKSEYQLAVNTEVEREWLGHEINDWLALIEQNFTNKAQ